MAEFEINLDRCPYCGNDDSFYRKVYISGRSEYHYSFDANRTADNTHLHESLNYKEGVYLYCGECRKNIGKVKKDEIRP